ncbi:MAG: TIGR03619 family F420-dependent LLM class oxidoreductase [Deltaproteobacteria bacterium]|nr:TIGR03619 family F420-dependent LLM class oxidoreductase [Deltaproteobacteria bacterium]
MPQKMRFGFMLFPFDRFERPQDFVEVAKVGEACGFHAVELADRLLLPRVAGKRFMNESWPDGITLAAYLAAATSTIRFLFNVRVVPWDSPFRLAKALATLDVVSAGRVLCGVGVGAHRDEFEQLGIPFDERGRRLDRHLRVMKELWTSETPAFKDERFSFSNVSFRPKPVQQPHIPLLIGGSGPRPLRRVIELGDGWTPMRGTLQQVRDGIQWIRRTAQEAGRDPDSFHFGFNGLAVGVDEAVLKARRLAGDTAAVARERTAAETIAEIEGYRSAGVNYLTIVMPFRTPAEYAGKLEQFAREVLPSFA